MKQHSLIQRFLYEAESFPQSVNKSTYEYDVNSLRKILHLKELKEMTGADDQTIEYIDSLDIQLGKLLPGIIRGEDLYDQYLEIEKKILDTVSGTLYIYSKQSALSVLSLILYKKSEFEQAVNITQECITLNEFLVNKGMSTMNVRIYEQIKNITKIYHRAGQNKKAIEIISLLFKHIYTGIPNSVNTFSSIVDNKTLWEKTPILREAYTNDVFLIYLQEFMRSNIYLGDEKLTELDWLKDIDFDVFTEDRKFIYNWIYITRLFYNKEYDEYLDCLEFFLDDDITSYFDILKVNLLLHFEKYVQESGLSESEIAIVQKNLRYYYQNKLQVNRNILQNILDESYYSA
nr:hypothetical protein [uncultured Chryseobacterium sp.]